MPFRRMMFYLAVLCAMVAPKLQAQLFRTIQHVQPQANYCSYVYNQEVQDCRDERLQCTASGGSSQNCLATQAACLADAESDFQHCGGGAPPGCSPGIYCGGTGCDPSVSSTCTCPADNPNCCPIVDGVVTCPTALPIRRKRQTPKMDVVNIRIHVTDTVAELRTPDEDKKEEFFKSE